MIAIFGGETYALVAVAEHGAAHLGAAVFEGEIPMSGGGSGKVTDFPFHPDKIEVAFQQTASLTVKLANREGGWG